MELRLAIAFKFTENILGDGFVSHVEIDGRALLEKYPEDEREWIVIGVAPSGVAGDGGTPQEAFSDYCGHLRSVLFDFAAEAGTHEEFEAMFEERLGPTELLKKQWVEARVALRKDPNLAPKGLRVVVEAEELEADREGGRQAATKVERPRPDLNVPDGDPVLAA